MKRKAGKASPQREPSGKSAQTQTGAEDKARPAQQGPPGHLDPERIKAIKELVRRRADAERAAGAGQPSGIGGRQISSLAEGREKPAQGSGEAQGIAKEAQPAPFIRAYGEEPSKDGERKRKDALRNLEPLIPREERALAGKKEESRAEPSGAQAAESGMAEPPDNSGEQPIAAAQEKPGQENAPPSLYRPPGALSTFSEGMSALYVKVPVLPFLDRRTSLALFVAFALYAAFAASFFILNGQNALPELVESPLNKNSDLAIYPGERYLYTISSDGTERAVVYETRSSPSCSGVVVVESSSQNLLCLSKDGTLENSGSAQLNSTFGNSAILLFSPWMLAVSDDFSWSVKTRLSSGSLKVEFPIRLESLGSTEIAGRQAYEVQVTSDFEQGATYFVDKEKRVLLFANFGNSTAKLVRAPFEVDWTREERAYSS